MNLSPEHIERVRYLVEDEWAREDKGWADFDRVLAQMSAEELHDFADKMNWDGGGAERLMRVLKHPKCDRGTALLIYWRADPVFDLKYGSRERVEAETWPARVAEWDMMRYIEGRLASNSFATARIPYEPQNDHGRDRTKPKEPRAWQLEERDGQVVRVDIQPPSEARDIDVRGSLPAVVFEPVRGGPAGT